LNKDWRFHVHADRFEIKDLVAKSDQELAAWLEQRWMQKSKRLEGLQGHLENGEGWSEGIAADIKKRS
jgi:hypothetical protein